jgi:membrane dipeptidase
MIGFPRSTVIANMGIGYWKTATCGTDAKAIARAIRYAVAIAGVDHVALGSDYDGAVSVPFDAAGLVELTDALLEAGFDREQLRKIMGGNVLRVSGRTCLDALGCHQHREKPLHPG